MKHFVERQPDDTPILLEGESFHFDLPKVGVAFRDKDSPIGAFHLWITSQRVIIINPDQVFQFDVPYIMLHAVTRDPESYKDPCVYCQLDYEGDEDEDEEEDAESTDTPLMSPKDEMFLVPEREEQLKDIFDALSHAALLNPCLNEFDEQEGDDELFYNEEEVAQGALNAEQSRVLDHLESVFVVPTLDSTSTSSGAPGLHAAGGGSSGPTDNEGAGGGGTADK
jgi:Regulator of volume decrease after cellular swelling